MNLLIGVPFSNSARVMCKLLQPLGSGVSGRPWYGGESLTLVVVAWSETILSGQAAQRVRVALGRTFANQLSAGRDQDIPAPYRKRCQPV